MLSFRQQLIKMAFQPGSFTLNLLNVKKREATPMLYMLGHAFLNGLGIALSFTAINVNILENHGVKVLPSLYIIAAILLLFGGLTYSKVEHHIRPGKLFAIAIAICAIWAVSMRFALGFSNSILIGGLAFSSYYIVYMLSNLEFWGAAALLFDVRQGKRLFGPLAVGESLAKILGYSLSGYIITKASLPDTFLVAGFSFLLSWLLFTRLKKKYDFLFQHAHGHHRGHDSTVESKESKRYTFLPIGSVLKSLMGDRFIRAASAFAMMSTLIYFTIHYAFLSQVKYEFKTLTDLATFFAIFLSLAKAVNLLIKLLLSSRILNYFGVRAGLYILPVTLLIINVFGLIGLFNFATDIHFFIIVFGLNYLADEALRSSLYTPSYLILFQPLARNKRLEGHTIAKGIMEPVGMGVAGVLIIAWQATGQFTLQVLTYYILGFTILWLLATRRVTKQYLKILSRALKSRILSRVRYDHSKEEVEMLRNEKLQSDDPFEVIYAARLLQSDLHTKEWKAIVRKLMSSDDPMIISEALGFIEEQHLVNFADQVKSLVFSEDKHCVERAAYCYASLKEEDSVPDLLNHVNDGDANRKMAIIGSILKHSGIYGAVSIGDEFLQLITSEKEAERIHAAHVIGQIANPKYYHPLMILLKDDSIAVRKAAIESAGSVINTRLISPLLDQLEFKALFSNTMSTLEKFGALAMPEIRKRASTTSIETLRRLIRVCSRISHPKSHQFLLPYIRSTKPGLRNEAIYSLFMSHYEASDAGRVAIDQAIEDDIQLLADLVIFYEQCRDEPYLGEALYNEMKSILVPRILYMMSLIYDRKSIIKIMENSRIAKGDYRSNALELMDNVLKRKHSRKFSVLIEKMFELEQVPSEPAKENCDIREFATYVFNRAPGELSYWLKANCIRASRRNRTLIHAYINDEPQHTHHKVLKEEWQLYEQSLY